MSDNPKSAVDCPRCQSPNTICVDVEGDANHRKCIVCGNCWRTVPVEPYHEGDSETQYRYGGK